MWPAPKDVYSRKAVQVISIPTPHPYQPGHNDSIPTYHCISTDEPPPQAERLPEHMKLDNWPNVPFPLNKVWELIITTCCLLCYGQRDLQEAWDACVEGGERWVAHEDRFAARVSQLNVIVGRQELGHGRLANGTTFLCQGGLIFTGLSAWATTAPPLVLIFDYNQRLPYVCILAAFGGTWSSITVGSTLMYCLSMAGPNWYREVQILSHVSIRY